MNETQQKPGGTQNLYRLWLGVIFGAVFIIAGIAVLNRLKAYTSVTTPDLSTLTYGYFYFAVLAIYLLSIILWGGFCRFTQHSRTYYEQFIDMGLQAVGKYVPGKIAGIASRGAYQTESLVLNRLRFQASLFEQLTVMIIGLVLATCFYVHYKWLQPTAIVSVILTIFSAWLSFRIMLFLVHRFSSLTISLTLSNLYTELTQSTGYLLLWLLTSVPMIILITTTHLISTTEALQLAAAFTIATIAGWIAIFSPGGLGIREAVFVLMAPDFLSWEEASMWIIVHRILTVLFDLAYGVLATLLVVRKVKYLEVS